MLSPRRLLRRAASVPLSLAAGVVFASCQLELEGAPCPCAAGHVCCPSTNTCERLPTSCAGPALPASSAPASRGDPPRSAADASAETPAGAGAGPEDAGTRAGTPPPLADAGASAASETRGDAGPSPAPGTPASARDAGSATSPVAPDASTDPSGARPTEPADPGDDEGCAIVVFCDAAGPEGTICQQESCSLELALDDCIEDSYFVCGAPTAPWLLRTLDGRELDIPLEASPGAP